MDIGHNLSYNGNTVHSGSFLEDLIRFGKETMQKMMRTIIPALAVCIFLCGCTRREQLVLEDISEEVEQQFDLLTVQEQVEPVAAEEQTGQQSPEQSTTGDSVQPQTIFVHVCGAVKIPDVYELPAGSRVYEAVQAAGGFTEEADSNYVNQAQILTDGVKLVIPTVEQTKNLTSDGEGESLIGIAGEQGSVDGLGITASDTDTGLSDASDIKININTASEAELCNIPGIGATRAAAIVAYRQEKGSFSSIEDIMNVSGIKEGTYEKIKNSIKVN